MEWPAHLPLERGRGVSMTALLLIIGNEKKKKRLLSCLLWIILEFAKEKL